MPVFGFKAKPGRGGAAGSGDCIMPVFGFKAKQQSQHPERAFIVSCLFLDSRQNLEYRTESEEVLYHACFWIQGKTQQVDIHLDVDCIMPVFGFKAKLAVPVYLLSPYCIMPVFGFKAKPHSLTLALVGIVSCLFLDSRQNVG